MRRIGRYLFIFGYLAVLGFGLARHTLGHRAHDHLGMYFIVWDMYCGWTAWETRNHVVGQGESGEWYDLSPPWGEMVPFGSASRRDYDVFHLHSGKIARMTLDHTDHEPIHRIMMVEEAWPKRYNLPDEVWKRRTPDPKIPHSYYHVVATYGLDGTLEAKQAGWTNVLAHNALINNPRLRDDIARSKPFLTIENLTGSQRAIQQTSFQEPAPFR